MSETKFGPSGFNLTPEQLQELKAALTEFRAKVRRIKDSEEFRAQHMQQYPTPPPGGKVVEMAVELKMPRPQMAQANQRLEADDRD